MPTTKSSDKITPFGGLNYCLESFHDSGLAGLIDRDQRRETYLQYQRATKRVNGGRPARHRPGVLPYCDRLR